MSDYLAPRAEGYPSGDPALVPTSSTDAGLGTSTSGPGQVGASGDSRERILDERSAGGSAADAVSDVAGTAKDEVRAVAGGATAAAKSVAQTASEETKAVVEQAKSQFQDLFWQSRWELTEQANGQQRRLAEGLRSVGQELDEMTGGAPSQGLAAEAAAQLSGRIHQVADFLDQRDVAGVLDELTGFARRRPGAFLLGAALLGVLAGRVTRGLTADSGGSTPSTAGAVDTVEPTRYEGVQTDIAPRVAPYGTTAVPMAYEPVPVAAVETPDAPYASPDQVSEPPRSGGFPAGAAEERLP